MLARVGIPIDTHGLDMSSAAQLHSKPILAQQDV